MTASRPAMTGIYLLALWLLMCPSGFALSPEERLAEARLELEIGMATEQRILDELNRYRAAGETSPERIALYETYLDRVRQLTEEKRKRVLQLEKARPQSASTAGGLTAPDPSPPDLDIPEDRELDKLRALRRELDQSIAAFDDMLLTESEVARVQSELKMKQLAQEAAQAARSIREGDEGGGEGQENSEAGLESGPSSSGGGEETGDTAEEGGMKGLEGDTGEAAAQEGAPKETGGGRYRAKGKVKPPSGQGTDTSTTSADQAVADQDDDIVARQLREAAEKETDPALKEKLWKEYYDYKKGL